MPAEGDAGGGQPGGFAAYPVEPGIRFVERGHSSRAWLDVFSGDEDDEFSATSGWWC